MTLYRGVFLHFNLTGKLVSASKAIDRALSLRQPFTSSYLFFCILATLQSKPSNMVLVETLTAGDSDTWSVWHPVGAPALPTIFTQPSSICSSKWIQNPLTSNEVISGFIYYSTATDRREYYGSLLSPNYYASCHPLRQAEPIAYSPGLCTADQTMLAIREFHYQTSRLWMGICCD